MQRKQKAIVKEGNENVEKSTKLPKKTWREKEFIIQDSPVDELFQKYPSARGFYNIFLAVLIQYILYDSLMIFVKTGTFGSTIFNERILGEYQKLFSSGLLVIGCLFLWSGFVYFLFKVWATLRPFFSQKSQKIWDWASLSFLLIIYWVPFYFTKKSIEHFNMTIMLSLKLSLETVRVVMKQHSFIRTNVPKILDLKGETKIPGFSKFAYFYWAPTLIYRDEYPRSPHPIRWKFIVTNFLEIFLLSVTVSSIVEKTVLEYATLGLKPISKWEIVLTALLNTLPGSLVFLGGCWTYFTNLQNIFAELLQFGDRRYYRNWWMSTSASGFMRNWNCLTQDWIYQFLYRDIYNYLVPNNALCTAVVFTISGVFHEVVMYSTFGLFLPIQFFNLVVIGALGPHGHKGNFFNMFYMTVGAGSVLNLYALEYFARLNCEPKYSGLADALLPRIFSCSYV